MTDLCWQCQRNNESVYRSANLPDSIKSEAVQAQEEHLAVVRKERSLYNSMIDDAKRVVANHSISDLSVHLLNSRDVAMHYSFDFAQPTQVTHFNQDLCIF